MGEGFEAFSEAFEFEMKRKSELHKTDFEKAVSPENFVAVRNLFGGPAPDAMDESFNNCTTFLAELSASFESREKQRALAVEARNSAFNLLMEG